MIAALQQYYYLAVFSSAYDLNDTMPLSGIKTDSWTSANIPNAKKSVNCWYASHKNPSAAVFKKQIGDLKPAVIYLNGMFSFRFVRIHLLSINKSKTKLVICRKSIFMAVTLSSKQANRPGSPFH